MGPVVPAMSFGITRTATSTATTPMTAAQAIQRLLDAPAGGGGGGRNIVPLTGPAPGGGPAGAGHDATGPSFGLSSTVALPVVLPRRSRFWFVHRRANGED